MTLLLLVGLVGPLSAGTRATCEGDCAAAAPAARIAIILDDLGYRLDAGRQAIALPGPLALAVLPHAPYSRRLAEAAHQAGKTVLLHQPMQGVLPTPLDRGALTLDMSRQRFERTLRDNLAALPYVSGVNNHMGSLLTRHPGHMAWLMTFLRRHGGLYFVDSRTSRLTVAARLAAEHQLPHAERDVFLDDINEPAEINRQWQRLLAEARRRGTAIAIGHPRPHTLALLQRELPGLVEAPPPQSVSLVPLATLIRPATSPPGRDSARPAARATPDPVARISLHAGSPERPR